MRERSAGLGAAWCARARWRPRADSRLGRAEHGVLTMVLRGRFQAYRKVEGIAKRSLVPPPAAMKY